MADVDGPTWKVGHLAQLTGLTVRTLHHYHQIGLLCPSARTSSGHRLYDERDVRRLYRIVALRELGLPLEVIGDLLTGQSDLVDLPRNHLSHLDRQLEALRALRRRLAAMVASVQVIGPPPAADLLVLIAEVRKMDQIMKQYFTDEQLTTLMQRHEKTGERATASVMAEWPQLIARVQAELDAGTDPAAPKVQTLARRWMELLEFFHGGDAGLRDAMYRMQADNSEMIQQQYGGPSAEMIDYIRRANAVSSS
ncbi:MAG: MerR family transcriptional regulator [Pseudonocardiaceae bacterium]